ncbi:hypothetical protein [Roseivivax marinus]|uniref:hypothetical protein n=1 Tax=Roseivivax marinus TaxID=1379903 RepID=UPI00273D08E7|nr:hypothetical protein [Roseivivax marinus]
MRAIFHLGTYKTGSTSFQNFAYEHRQDLMLRGMLYPETGLRLNDTVGARHTPLIFRFLGGALDIVPGALEREINQSSCEKLLFSSEAWSAPGHAVHLLRFTMALRDLGFSDQVGYVFLRNLVDYKVSHYREFTLNRSNVQPFSEYVSRKRAVFDYLLLLSTFRLVFHHKLSVIPFDKRKDSSRVLASQLGVEDLYNSQAATGRGNVRNHSALEVEAVRCARSIGLTPLSGLQALEELVDEGLIDKDEMWTEVNTGEREKFSKGYIGKIMDVSGWAWDECEAVLNSDQKEGRNVSELSKLITDRISATSF